MRNLSFVFVFADLTTRSLTCIRDDMLCRFDMTGSGQLGRRVASLYQDKEARKKSKINEENNFYDSLREISSFFNWKHFDKPVLS
jgi:hypothetical protein